MHTSAAHAGVSGRKSMVAAKIRRISVEDGAAPKRKVALRRERERVVGRPDEGKERRARVAKGTNEQTEQTPASIPIPENIERAGEGWNGGWTRRVGIRAELKAGKTRSGYITACKCGQEREEWGGGGAGGDRARTSVAIRKSGIRSRNIEKRVDIPSGIKRARTRGSGEKDRKGQTLGNEKEEEEEEDESRPGRAPGTADTEAREREREREREKKEGRKGQRFRSGGTQGACLLRPQ